MKKLLIIAALASIAAGCKQQVTKPLTEKDWKTKVAAVRADLNAYKIQEWEARNRISDLDEQRFETVQLYGK